MLKNLLGFAGGVAACTVAAIALWSMSASAAIQAAPAIGTKLPDFAMTDYTGKEHKLSDFKDKIVVMSFTSQHCPVSRAKEGAYVELYEKYTDKGVVFLSIDAHDGTTAETIAAYANATWEEGDAKNETGKKLPYPILKDEGNVYADLLGAKRTPEIYIADKDGNLAYHGGIDNNKKADDPAYKPYVAEALDALLAGEPVKENKTSAYGCGIKRSAH
ncbi:MAG: thioredoxin family protein [Candidatus Hydrogenedentota bacterium]